MKLRQRQADLLGYPNHAAYKLVSSLSQVITVIKSPKTTLFAGGDDGEEPRECGIFLKGTLP